MPPTSNVPLPKKENSPYADKILSFAVTIWFMLAASGQWLFGAYILLFYGKSTMTGDFEKWNQVLPHGYVAGDWKGNLIVGSHVLLAAVLVIGGPFQLVPQVRRHFPVFHRLLGRVYVVTAIGVSIAGLVMVWTRGTVGDTTQHLAISVQSVYIVFFALLSIRSARARQFAQHRIWALRLFLVVNGVWFFRIGLMCWLLVNSGPAGFDPKTFTGPFLNFLSVFIYAIPFPLIILEMYLYALRKQNSALSYMASVIIFALSIITAIGIAGATMGMWLPRI
jgi:uncharacterized membrane protein